MKRPRTSGLCERFSKTLPGEFYRVAFRRKVHDTVEALPLDLDGWITIHDGQRTHQGGASARRPCGHFSTRPTWHAARAA